MENTEMEMTIFGTDAVPVNQKKQAKKPLIVGIAAVAVVAVTFLIILASSKKTAEGFTVLNTNKSVYSPNEMAVILISTTDKEGKTLCHSNLEVMVTGPDKTNIGLSTENEMLPTSTTCAEDGTVTNNPDYQSGFVPKLEGIYKIKLTNLDTNAVIEKKIGVKKDIDFNIERQTTTRLNPSETVRYHMVLKIFSKNNFKGQVVETIPSSIKIAWVGEAKLEAEKITWGVDIKAGETKELIYDYVNPTTELKIYDFGPASMSIGSRRVFAETSSWQGINAYATK
ncbi:MAG: hypothetical protein UU64_C0017G0002 [candidate division WWE3 bacterium GW2011_GWF2_41_45]|uniref:Uncharacterized protein n=2 Tax=Katanobacteria TaxID=422282 RepID=A0A1F4W2W4_UNCKA|nr:MAG: hypothetical protein UU55_C0008G0019 [candidate division WWE3 bacterium GW2011_GWC2_41_23]KKS09220.1 MAG: hypothetical protein UU64_C0017G0002 [candidate division WWE3 bacterium GW2011_GWF2_41_45]KKS19980.1 MAG: hypothetical protein UU79_C0006G0019 [candidate division WWE3 bacterium GW2011_GWE1_41_72]KKS28248.1 MAG: hypothetical protein UU90_C0032G0004 [candidate division WWE3 bacterium GW2011_GWD2_42_11]KKS49918.1 MAG: hypothetical protein UV16_C0016G0002 [candidate division WWE3 bacte